MIPRTPPLRATLLSVLALVVVTAGAQANSDVEQFQLPRERHCVAKVPRADADLLRWDPSIRCFDTFSEALSTATARRVQLPPTFRSGDLTPELLAALLVAAPSPDPRAAASSTVVGIDWWDANFTGSTYIWYVDNPNGCYDGSRYAYPGMPAGWDNQVSSARGYQGCNNYIHFEHPDFGGAQINCDTGNKCATMGIMNDQTSSEKWEP